MSQERKTVKNAQSEKPANAKRKGSPSKVISRKSSAFEDRKQASELFKPLTSGTVIESIEFLLNTFKTEPAQQRKMANVISVLIQAKIKQRSPDGQPIHWAYVPTLPTERSSGRCLSLDFGSSNSYFQVALCNITGSESTKNGEVLDGLDFQLVDRQAFLLVPTLRHAHMDVFCNFVAICVRKLMQENGVTGTESDPVPMGVVAAFDNKVVPQANPIVATVFATFKEYRMKGFLNKDFIAKFHSAFKRANINVRIVAVMNDTVSTLMWGIYKVSSTHSMWNADCSISIVSNHGGANMSYLETEQEFLDMCSNDRRLLLRTPKSNANCAVVNTESGMLVILKEMADLLCSVEKELSDQLNVPIRFEFLSSGIWYPELLICCIDMLRTTHVLGQHMQRFENLPRATCYQVFSVCDNWLFEKGTITDLTTELRKLCGKSLTDVDSVAVSDICQAIMSRTGQALASGVMALANKLYGKLFPTKMVLACDGSMFRLTQLEFAFRESLSFMVPEGIEVCLLKSDWAFGCAALAISAAKMQKKNS